MAEWALGEELRFGSLDDSETSLTIIGGLAVTPDGRMYVTQPTEQRVRIIGPDGAVLGAFGRQGEGPGEFRRSTGSIGLRGDTLWVTEYGRGVQLFDLDGHLIQWLNPVVQDDPSAALTGRPRPSGVLPTGELWGSPGIPSSMVADGQITHQLAYRISRDGRLLDTLYMAALRNGSLAIQSDARGGFGFYTSAPFPDRDRTAVSPDSAVLHLMWMDDEDLPTYRLVKTSLAADGPGDTIFDRRFRYDPTPIDQTVLDSSAEAVAKPLYERLGFGQPEAVRMAREAIHVPIHYPPFSGLHVGDDASIWILRERVLGADSVTWEVLDPDGTPIGRLRLGRNQRILAATRDNVWMSETDELDVPYLVRYAVSAGEVGGAGE